MEAEKENNENSLLDDWSETKKKKLKKGGERVGVETDRKEQKKHVHVSGCV